jgi:hypothetical protein
LQLTLRRQQSRFRFVLEFFSSSYFALGTPRSLQIFLASSSGISLCRGTADRLFCSGLCHHECRPPSRRSSHPLEVKCRKRSLRFIRRSEARDNFPRQTNGHPAGLALSLHRE